MRNNLAKTGSVDTFLQEMCAKMLHSNIHQEQLTQISYHKAT